MTLPSLPPGAVLFVLALDPKERVEPVIHRLADGENAYEVMVSINTELHAKGIFGAELTLNGAPDEETLTKRVEDAVRALREGRGLP